MKKSPMDFCADFTELTELTGLASARKLAMLALAAYDDPVSFSGYSMQQLRDEKTSTRAVCGLAATHAVIVFPGTEDASDILTDLEIGLKLWKDVNTSHAPPAEFHSGFLDCMTGAVCAWLDGLLPTLRHDKITRVDVVGHSLGGALAQLASLYLALLGLAGVECTTFGSPRVGNDVAARLASGAPFGLRNFMAREDPVVMLPPQSFGYWRWGAGVGADMRPGRQVNIVLPNATYVSPSDTWSVNLLNLAQHHMQHYVDLINTHEASTLSDHAFVVK